jgi:hypothetical protein
MSPIRVHAAIRRSACSTSAAGLRRADIARPVSAARPAKIAHAHSAGLNQAVTAAGLARPPYVAKTVLPIATPNTAPKRCAM